MELEPVQLTLYNLIIFNNFSYGLKSLGGGSSFITDSPSSLDNNNKSQRKENSLLSLSRRSPHQLPVTLDEALQNLVATLEDYRGQWAELRELEAQVGLVEEVLRGEVSQL